MHDPRVPWMTTVTSEDPVATKEAQISVRLPEDLDRWVEERAGGKREKPAFIRHLLERERDAEEEAAMQQMFDDAWDSLSAKDRAEVEAEREAWFSAYSGGKG